jgi:hypothetical protein
MENGRSGENNHKLYHCPAATTPPTTPKRGFLDRDLEGTMGAREIGKSGAIVQKTRSYQKPGLSGTHRNLVPIESTIWLV